MSPEESRRAESILRAAVQVSRYSGPLPPPEIMAKYEEALPGSADRILRMAEQQANHRQNLERTVIKANAVSQIWGMILGFILALTAIAGGVWLSLRGLSGAGLTAIISALAALVGVFIYGKAKQRQDLDEKSSSLALHDSD